MTTPEPRPRCRKLRGTFRGCRRPRSPGRSLSSSPSPKNRRKKSSPSNCAGATVALPSTRMVTTAGATALTTSEYESREPAASALPVTVCVWADSGASVELADVAARPRHAAPVTSAAAAATARPARTRKRRVFIADGPFLVGLSIRLTRLDGRSPFGVVTGTLQIGKVPEVPRVPGVPEVLSSKFDRKGRALARHTVNAHRAAMGFDDGLDEAQAEAEAASRAALVAAEGPLPDAWKLSRRNPDSRVTPP